MKNKGKVYNWNDVSLSVAGREIKPIISTAIKDNTVQLTRFEYDSVIKDLLEGVKLELIPKVIRADDRSIIEAEESVIRGVISSYLERPFMNQDASNVRRVFHVDNQNSYLLVFKNEPLGYISLCGYSIRFEPIK